MASSQVNIAEIVTNADLEVVSFVDGVGKELSHRALYAGHMFSRPAHRDDRLAYLSTQFVAETLKAHGVQGIMYESFLNPGGVNLAVFHHSVLRCERVRLMNVLAVDYEAVELAV